MDLAMTKLDLLPILLLAISSNGDNVAVGIAYGLGRIDVPLPSNFLIAIVTGAGTLASMWLGQAIGSVMDPRLASAAGGVLVVAVGGWVMLQSIRATTVGKSSRILTMNSEQGRSVSPLGKLMLVLKNPAGLDAGDRLELEQCRERTSCRYVENGSRSHHSPCDGI